MKAYLANLPTSIWALAVIPLILLAYPIVHMVFPALVHALVPDVVRSVLNVI
jgi:hypothetical protein